jgi:hypothetical protein
LSLTNHRKPLLTNDESGGRRFESCRARHRNPRKRLVADVVAIGSRGIIARCEFCGRPVFLARTYPVGRRRRRDKRFCDDACRQALHCAKEKS